jgi:hypothetical protein
MSSRRQFVKLGTLCGVSLASTGLAAQAAPATAGTRGQFAAQLGRPFTVADGPSRGVVLVLESVADPALLGVRDLAGHPECFSAAFRGPAGALGQGTCTLANDGLGTLALFLVPVGRPRGESQLYEASFNCVVPG